MIVDIKKPEIEPLLTRTLPQPPDLEEAQLEKGLKLLKAIGLWRERLDQLDKIPFNKINPFLARQMIYDYTFICIDETNKAVEKYNRWVSGIKDTRELIADIQRNQV